MTSDGKNTYVMRGKKEIILYQIPLVSYNGTVLQKGFHKVEFHFDLPPQLPGSFAFFASADYARV